MSSSDAIYSDAQANEILRTAVRLAAPGDITFDEMVRAAKELGISRDELKEAEERYKQICSDTGQRDMFREMQKHEIKAFSFRMGLLALLLTLIVFIDLREAFLFLFPVLLLAWGLAAYLKWRFVTRESPKHEEAFLDWQRKKKLWLRPEDAKQVVDELFAQRLSLGERLENKSTRDLMRKRLREKFGYDRKRTIAVVDAYLAEHPELESRFGK